MPKSIDMVELWARYRRGDPATDAELIAMYRQIEAAMPYIDSRRAEYHLVLVDTYRIQGEIEGYLRARGYNLERAADGMNIIKKR